MSATMAGVALNSQSHKPGAADRPRPPSSRSPGRSGSPPQIRPATSNPASPARDVPAPPTHPEPSGRSAPPPPVDLGNTRTARTRTGTNTTLPAALRPRPGGPSRNASHSAGPAASPGSARLRPESRTASRPPRPSPTALDWASAEAACPAPRLLDGAYQAGSATHGPTA